MSRIARLRHDVKHTRMTALERLEAFPLTASSELEPFQQKIKQFGECDEAQRILESEIKPRAESYQNELLNDIMPEIMEEYKLDYNSNYTYFNEIKDASTERPVQKLQGEIKPQDSDVEMEKWLRWLSVAAGQDMLSFGGTLRQVQKAMSTSLSFDEIIKKMRIKTPSDDLLVFKRGFPDDLKRGLHLDLQGPVTKGINRMLDKARASRAKGNDITTAISDPLRAKFVSDSPYALALVCMLIIGGRKSHEVIRIKNRMLAKDHDQPPNINMNLRLKSGLVVELQFVLKNIALIQEYLHIVYELGRASSALAAAEVHVGEAPVLVVIGATGVGKSALCRAMTGDARFISAATTASVTDWAEASATRWLGQQGNGRVVVVDTPGLADEKGDVRHLFDLVEKLKNWKRIHGVLLVLSGLQYRFDGNLMKLLQIMHGTFGPKLWRVFMIAFNHWYDDLESQRRRDGDRSDWAERWSDAVREKFDSAMSGQGPFPCVFLDAKAAEGTEGHNNLVNQLEILRKAMVRQAPLDTSKISAAVIARNAEEALDQAVKGYADSVIQAILNAKRLDFIPDSLHLKLQQAITLWIQTVSRDMCECHGVQRVGLFVRRHKQADEIDIQGKASDEYTRHVRTFYSQRVFTQAWVDRLHRRKNCINWQEQIDEKERQFRDILLQKCHSAWKAETTRVMHVREKQIAEQSRAIAEQRAEANERSKLMIMGMVGGSEKELIREAFDSWARHVERIKDEQRVAISHEVEYQGRLNELQHGHATEKEFWMRRIRSFAVRHGIVRDLAILLRCFSGWRLDIKTEVIMRFNMAGMERAAETQLQSVDAAQLERLLAEINEHTQRLNQISDAASVLIRPR